MFGSHILAILAYQPDLVGFGGLGNFLTSCRWIGNGLQSLDVVSYIPGDYFALFVEYMVEDSCDVVAESGGQVVSQKEESLPCCPCRHQATI